MRVFIAVQLSEDMKKVLLRHMRTLRKNGVSGNYTPLSNMHLTLCFIGETKQPEKILEILRGIRFEPFRITLQGMGRFGDLLWAGVDGGDPLYALAGSIRTALEAEGISFDSKEFHPHVTLLRRMSGADGTAFLPEPAEMTVSGISLMRSDRVNGRMVYTCIGSAMP